jgi:hypothetical protein
MSLEKTSMNRFLNSNEMILIRSKFDALPPFGNYLSFTNFSRSFEFSIFNENGNEISIKTNRSIELIIPRDSNLIFPQMILQNVTNSNHLKLIDLKKTSTKSKFNNFNSFSNRTFKFEISQLSILNQILL